MKKTFKTISIYFGVLLLTLIATVIFCAGFLFFYRDGNIFGIQYIKLDQRIIAKQSADMSGVENIEINCKDFDVAVKINSNVENVIGAMRNKVFGYANKNKAQTKFVLEYNDVSKTATFTATEPSGWLNKSDAYIEIAIPKSLADRGLNLYVKTSKADVSIGGSEDCAYGTVGIKTSKGDAKIKNAIIINKLDLNIGSGTVVVGESCGTTDMIGANLKVGSGTIDLTEIDTNKFYLGTVEVIKNVKGKINILQAKEVVTNGNINGGGKVQIKEVGFVDFISLDTHVYINKITENTMSRIKLTGNGKVVVNQVVCDLEVNANDGSVKINEAFGTLALSTDHGDIAVGKTLKLVSAATVYGNIKIGFSDSALDYADTSINDSNKNRAVVATTKNGHIIVEGLQNGHINATGSGRISLSYNKVVGTNEINGKLGNVSIVVPNPSSNTSNEYAFNLRVKSDVNADIKVGVAGSIGRVDFSESGVHEFTNIYNSTTSTSNSLYVESSTGSIKVRSLDLVNY